MIEEFKYIEHYLKGKGVSVTWLASQIGVSVSHLNPVLLGKRTPSKMLVILLDHVVRCDMIEPAKLKNK